MAEVDLAGPLIFCLMFAATLLAVRLFSIYISFTDSSLVAQAGKVHFGYIYGVATLGCISLYAVRAPLILAVEEKEKRFMLFLTKYCFVFPTLRF